MPRVRLLAAAALGGVAALALSACSDTKSGDQPAPTSAAASAATPATTPPATTAATAAATVQQPSVATAVATALATAAAGKVSANKATRAQLTAAFEAAGIPNAATWAKEVEEYRPYPTNDPTMAKLRQNLAKYNPAAGVVDKIVATLSLDQ